MQVSIKEEIINQLSTEIETLRDQEKEVEEKVGENNGNTVKELCECPMFFTLALRWRI